MKTKIFSLALLLMITTAGVWAQMAMTGWESPQSETTVGRYRSYADDFIRPDYYSGVKFDKWLGLVSFKTSSFANVGLATKIKDVYIGAFYSGQFWGNAPVNNYTEETRTPTGGGLGVYDVYSTDPSVGDNTKNPQNNVAVLIGAANMGFRLTFRTNYQRFNEDGIVVGSQLYNNYKAEFGYLIPQIGWAMAKDLTKNGIRPYLTFDLGFQRNYLAKDEAGGSGVSISRSANHIDPSFALGLGGYNLYNKNGFKLTADLDYVLTFNVYNNDYSYTDGGVNKTGNIKGTFDSSAFSEQFLVSNTVTPSLAGSWSKDRLALKFKLNLVFGIGSKDTNAMGLNSSNNLVYDGASNDVFTFSFSPDLRLAMQYKLIPDKLTLNMGARLQATAIQAETTDTTTYSSGIITASTKGHKYTMGNFNTRLAIGLSLNLTENFWTEFSTGSTNAYSNGDIDVGKMFIFGSLLVGLKF